MSFSLKDFLIALLNIALVALFFMTGAVILLFAIPIIVIGYFLFRLKFRKMQKEMEEEIRRRQEQQRQQRQSTPGDGKTIEAEYRVIEEREPGEKE